MPSKSSHEAAAALSPKSPYSDRISWSRAVDEKVASRTEAGKPEIPPDEKIEAAVSSKKGD